LWWDVSGEMGGKEMNTEKFEPMDVKKLPHLYTVSDVQIQKVIREAKSGGPVVRYGMLRALEVLGLPS
jgi:hypothetical protein